MKVSYQWLKSFFPGCDFPSAIDCAKILTDRGLEVEEIRNLSEGLESVVTAKILEKGKHPNSDRLSLCTLTAGEPAGTTYSVICGAQNHRQGDIVAMAKVGAHLPNGLNITKSTIRGVDSEGMLCSEEEMGMGKGTVDGILILPPETPLGLPIASLLGRGDVVYTLKLYANQGYAHSHLGVAREIGAHFGWKPMLPKILAESKVSATQSSSSVTWKEAKDLVKVSPQSGVLAFDAGVLEKVKIQPSPREWQTRLQNLDQKSINSVVDATNLLMLEIGHPVHAYDQAKLAEGKLGVRLAKEGEAVALLDDSEIQAKGGEILITDGKGKPQGLAGVMGGQNSKVSDATVSLLLECAVFDPVLVRKAKVKHQKHTEAALRFEKTVDVGTNQEHLLRLVEWVRAASGGEWKGGQSYRADTLKSAPAILFTLKWLNQFLGVSLVAAKVSELLESLDCQVHVQDDRFEVAPASYRSDLKVREDLAEEVARSLGYDQILAKIPTLSSSPNLLLPASAKETVFFFDWIEASKNAFSQLGLSEALHYGFGDPKDFTAWNTAVEAAIPVANPLSEEFAVMVPSLLPGLLKSVKENQNSHFGSQKPRIALFEIRPTFHRDSTVVRGSSVENGSSVEMDRWETGIREDWKIAYVLSDERADFFKGKQILEGYLERMGLRGVRLQPAGDSALFHPAQSVDLVFGRTKIGTLGTLHPSLERKHKLRGETVLAEWSLSSLQDAFQGKRSVRKFKDWFRHPTIERDFAFVLSDEFSAEALTQEISKVAKTLATSVSIFDVYRGSGIPEGHRSLAVRLVMGLKDRALQESEAEGMATQVIDAVQKRFQAKLR